jgi:hypothetical protein
VYNEYLTLGGFGWNVHIDAIDCPDSMGRYINDNFDPTKLNVKFVKLRQEKKALVIATRAIKVCHISHLHRVNTP